MDFNKTKTFIEIVTAGSFSKAAKKLFRTHQALSMQMKALEQELGGSDTATMHALLRAGEST